MGLHGVLDGDEFYMEGVLKQNEGVCMVCGGGGGEEMRRKYGVKRLKSIIADPYNFIKH